MATTALEVFEASMALLGLQDGSGAADTAENLAYKNKTVPFLNLLLQECLPASDTYGLQAGVDGRYPRPAAASLSSISDVIPLDDGVCRCVLPYGLAVRFLMAEDDSSGKASFYQQKYEENLALMKRSVPAVSEEIGSLYGGCSRADGVRWG